MNKKVEILAPAGSFECLVAAVKSGADAIYVGGSKFGARANANNFDVEELKRAIDFVHLHGRQLYLTINTLLKEEELQAELYEFLLPLYQHGIDAVIVQDLGVLQYVRTHFPDLPIHASTQMTVTSLLGAKFLARQGVERVVTSRELSVEEVAVISEQTGLEIESFVHGALCYSFSGQCLYSSMIGGRSGNRGQCAQPCRLPYQQEGSTDYLMSLKDICTLHEIPALVEAGVFSFKIEGRMKKPEYVASVTAMYRKYVDRYLATGRDNYRVSEEDVDALRDIFNRGDFHGGYWKQHNGAEMITKGKPNHTGLPVIRIVGQESRVAKGRALKYLRKGDILEINDKGDNYTLGRDYAANEIVELSLRKGVLLPKGRILYRTRNQWLIDQIYSDLDGNKLQEPVKATLILMAGSNAILNLEMGDCYITVEGEAIQQAEKAPIRREKIIQQMKKTGNTPFRFCDLDLIIDDDIFVPVQQLNQLRREGLERLEQAVTETYRRVLNIGRSKEEKAMTLQGAENCNIQMTAYVETMEQLEIVRKEALFRKVYVDCNAITRVWNHPKLGDIVAQVQKENKQIYLVMPHIFRKDTIQHYEAFYQKMLEANLDGVMVRNLESFEFLKGHGYQGEILLDHHVYMYNNSAIRFWKENGCHQKTHALELTGRELGKLEQDGMELMVYGYIPNMISAQCIKKTTQKCTHNLDIIKIKDRLNKEISVKSCCDYCYNIVYHTNPLCLFDELEAIRALKVGLLRVSFTIENKNEVKKVIDSVRDFYYDNINTMTEIETTKGHFRRGVR